MRNGVTRSDSASSYLQTNAVSAKAPRSVLVVAVRSVAFAQVVARSLLSNHRLALQLSPPIILRLEKAAHDIARTGETDIFGLDATEQTAKLRDIAEKINSLTAKKVAQINSLTATVNAEVARRSQAGGTQPPTPPIDNKSGSGDDGNMEKRLDKLESTVEKMAAQLASVQESVAVIKSNYATKDDVTSVKGDVGVIKSNYATREDLSKLESTILKVFITTAISLTALVFAVVKYIH
jgi:hypothetical protein